MTKEDEDTIREIIRLELWKIADRIEKLRCAMCDAHDLPHERCQNQDRYDIARAIRGN